MILIRKDQLEAFRQTALHRFEEELVAHSRDFAPELSKIIGEERLRSAIRAAMTRANRYGFTNRGPLRLFVEMMFLFGSAFDTDPQYPWAARILLASSDQMQRAERLYEQVLDYQEKVSGAEAVNTFEALRRLSFLARHPLTDTIDGLEADPLQQMREVFPQKAAYLGNEALRALVQEGCAVARQAHFSTARASTLIVALMYAFGHGCVNDPLYPWIANTLQDERILDPAARAARLERKALTWLDQVLANSSRAP
ncbi:MAG: hypothetical protein LGR52_12340 [Candidatus Thiosymbion ectosymbiont of Robbea hypermnestra]|nr:hypothetical protein [Candidatus Thiosymbion ectosymbiont of Robbea hypermnestra]